MSLVDFCFSERDRRSGLGAKSSVVGDVFPVGNTSPRCPDRLAPDRGNQEGKEAARKAGRRLLRDVAPRATALSLRSSARRAAAGATPLPLSRALRSALLARARDVPIVSAGRRE